MLAPRIGYMPGDTKAQDKAREHLAPYRKWYRTARWARLRQTILVRDLYQCQMCNRISSTGMVVDHIKPHRGDAALFWREDNLQCLCAGCHSSAKQKLEQSPEFR